MKVLFYSLLLLISFPAISQKTTYQTITVEPFLKVANDAFFKKMVINSPDTYADYIDGFNFIWGYHYKLKIKAVKIPNPPMDASDTEFTLVKLISKTKVQDNYEFDLLLERDLYLGQGEQVSNFNLINDSTYLYFNNIEIEVPASLKNNFGKIIENNADKVGTFTFISEKKIRLKELKERN